MTKICVLDERKVCDECGNCDRCDLDPSKKCNNCMKCVQQSDAEYYEIRIDDITKPDPEMEKLLKELLKSKKNEENGIKS